MGRRLATPVRCSVAPTQGRFAYTTEPALLLHTPYQPCPPRTLPHTRNSTQRKTFQFPNWTPNYPPQKTRAFQIKQHNATSSASRGKTTSRTPCSCPTSAPRRHAATQQDPTGRHRARTQSHDKPPSTVKHGFLQNPHGSPMPPSTVDLTRSVSGTRGSGNG
jgi:hypothetical protein